MVDQLKNMIIGLFVIAALGILILMIMFITPSIGDQKQTLNVRFSDINNINVGTRVLFAGKPVGEVVKIEPIPGARNQSVDEGGVIYYYQLILHIDSSVVVYNTDEITIETSGLLGERSIAIVPRAAPNGVIPKKITDQPIYGSSEEPLQRAIRDMSEVANAFEGTLNRVSSWIDDNYGNMTLAIKNFGAAMHSVDTTLEEIQQKNIIGGVQTALQNFSDLIAQAQEAMNVLDRKDAFHNLGDMLKHLNTASGSIELIAQDIADGKGTLGRLVSSDDLYLRVSAIMSKIDTLMNDVNHYGLLFNLDKKWQRTRMKRMNLLDDLQSPQCFRQFFEKEVDQINTSMARLSLVVQKAEQSCEKEEIFKNIQFQKDFRELLLEVNGLADSLRLYNEEILQVDP